MDPSISAEAPAPTTAKVSEEKKPEQEKVTVKLQPVGDAPILKQKKFMMAATNNIACLTASIRKMLNLPSDKSLHFYISSTFAPSPDHTLEVLRQCYGLKSADGSKDILHMQYSTTPAWG